MGIFQNAKIQKFHKIKIGYFFSAEHVWRMMQSNADNCKTYKQHSIHQVNNPIVYQSSSCQSHDISYQSMKNGGK